MFYCGRGSEARTRPFPASDNAVQMDELIVGILALPGWVQGCLAFFAFALLVMLFETSVRNRGVAWRFAALAAALECTGGWRGPTA